MTYCPPRGPLVRSDFPAARQQAPNQHCAVLRAVSGSSLGFLNDGIPVSKMLNTLYWPFCGCQKLLTFLSLPLLSGRAFFCISTRFHGVWKKCSIVSVGEVTYQPVSFVLFSKLCFSVWPDIWNYNGGVHYICCLSRGLVPAALLPLLS